MIWEWVALVIGLMIIPVVVFGGYYLLEWVVSPIARIINKIKGE